MLCHGCDAENVRTLRYSEVESGTSCGGVVVCKESQNTAGQFGC